MKIVNLPTWIKLKKQFYKKEMGFRDVIGAPFKLVGKGIDAVGGVAQAGIRAASGLG